MTTNPDDLRICLLACTAAAGLARTLIESRLQKWGFIYILDDTLLVATELIANAVAATPGKRIELRLTRETTGVVVRVWDSSDLVPRTRPAAALTPETLDLSEEHWDDNGGWGLPLVMALATRCGHVPDPPGGSGSGPHSDERPFPTLHDRGCSCGLKPPVSSSDLAM